MRTSVWRNARPLGIGRKIEGHGMGKTEAGENGRFAMTFPVKESKDIRMLFFWIDTPGYAPCNGLWFRPEADPVTSEFSVKLEKGTTIGGMITDNNGKSIADATLMMSIEWENS